jgi:hypothetical protein
MIEFGSINLRKSQLFRFIGGTRKEVLLQTGRISLSMRAKTLDRGVVPALSMLIALRRTEVTFSGKV